MPTPTISTKIAMDGEKEYKAALAEINSGLKVLSSEMKLTATQFAENADSMEALTATGDVLERQILSQKEKIETLKAALQNSAEAFGESDAKTQKWQVSLNNAEAELVKMERELRDNQAAIQDATEAADENRSILDKLGEVFGNTGGEAKSLGEVTEEVAGKLGINLPDGAKKALDALGDVNAETVLLAGGAATAAAALVEIEKALIALTTDRAAAATELANIAQTINMDVEATQQWDYVLKTVGSSIEEAQGDLSAFQEKIMEAKTGTGEAAEMFAKLGVNIVDQNGVLRDTEAVLLDTVHALQLMADETDRNATSSILLGGTGEKLIPIYNQSAESLNYLLEKKKELGVLTGDEIEALKDVSEALIDYEERVNHAKDTVAVEFAPALTAFYELAGEGVLTLGEAAEKSGLVNFFAATLDTVSALAPAIEILGNLLAASGPIIDGFAISLGFAADALSVVLNLASALVNVLDLNFSAAGDNFANIGDILTGNNSATARAWKNSMFSGIGGGSSGEVLNKYNYEQYAGQGLPGNASGDQNFGGGLTWVGENGPELAYLPQGTRIYSNQESRGMGGDTFNFNIEARSIKELNDLVKMAQEERRKRRMEGAE